MKCNVGPVDRVVRIIIGVAIVLVGVIFKSWWGLIGVIPLVTALLGKCLFYMPFGVNTCKKDK
ncbi:MAG: DUF2892 domain-containing protein [Candidatus Margulisbacteria bacterium]|nr:DUF2892 domain-containing protein [Candidatus Margulisiibacteriota bacterium]